MFLTERFKNFAHFCAITHTSICDNRIGTSRLALAKVIRIPRLIE
jgi:hypothetical protein